MKLKNTFIILALLAAAIGFGFKGCKEKGVGTKPDSDKEAWEFIQSISSSWINLPNVRPALVSGPRAVKIYSEVPLTQETMDAMVRGVRKTLQCSNRNDSRFNPPDWWQKDGKPFSVEEHYSILVKKPNSASESEKHRGCGLIHVRNGFELLTAIGTNAGYLLINNVPKAPKGLYLVIAGPMPDEPAESQCDVLREEGTRNEAEHARAMGAPEIWRDVARNDFPPNPGHPYFKCEGEARLPNGERPDYANFTPRDEQLWRIELTDEQLRQYRDATAEE